MKRWLLLTWVLLLPAILLGQASNLAPELQQLGNDGKVAVIVQYRSAPGSVHEARIQARRGSKLIAEGAGQRRNVFGRQREVNTLSKQYQQIRVEAAHPGGAYIGHRCSLFRRL